ncbi:unnamed protein product [Cladocopium goreaui]|uniref:Uncharacterized protein n=1 Tax=Cladocopium goreaui TaxID=2562237 RepID=A0A9P1CUL1_9DINO|nr:unnamed protein product [Cladocopium goreaui]
MTVQVDDKAFADLLEVIPAQPAVIARTGGLGSSRGVAAAQGADPHLPIPWFLVAVLQEQVTVLILEAPKFQSFTLRLFAVRFSLRFKAATFSPCFLSLPFRFRMASMMGAMGGAMNEAAKKAVEDELATKAPATMKPFFPCLGGPVGTMETCMCMVPADQQDSVKQAIAKYKSL